jgi:YVTN family beta-propeller protein
MTPTLDTDSFVAGYRIIDVIGRGGMGVVYRALQPSLDRQIALKVLAESLTQDARFRERFIRESRIAASIEHPHVLPVIEAGEDAGVLFLAMQYVPEGDLAHLLHAHGQFAPPAALAVLTQVASALDRAHARGLVHRDVKPGNLLVAEQGGRRHVYLTDFGVSSRHGSHSGLTAVDGWVGTVDYVAPEQIRGVGVDRCADVYSLGCVFFETLTGKVPFARENEIATLWAHMRDDPPRASATPGVPARLDPVLARALEKDPQRRYQSAGEFAADAAETLASTTARVGVRKASTRSGLRQLAHRLGTRRVWPLAVAALGAGAGAAAVLALTLPGGHRAARSAPSQRPVGVVVGKPIPVGSRPHAVAMGLGGVWVANSGDDTVSVINVQTNTVAGQPIKVGRAPEAIALVRHSVWVANNADGTVTRISAPHRKVVAAPIRVGSEPYALARAGRYLWVASEADGTLTQIDTRQGSAVGKSQKVSDGLGGGLAADRRTVWVGSYTSGTLQRVDAGSGRPLGGRLAVGGHPQAIALGGRYVWVALTTPDAVVRLDRRSGRAIGAPTPIGPGPPTALIVSGRDVWIASNGGQLSRIDARTNRLRGRPIVIGQITTSIALGAGGVWTASQADDTVTRVEPTP